MASIKKDKRFATHDRGDDDVYRDNTKNATIDEIKIGKLTFSFFPQGTIMAKLGDKCEDWTLVSSSDADKLIKFLQRFIDSYKENV